MSDDPRLCQFEAVAADAELKRCAVCGFSVRTRNRRVFRNCDSIRLIDGARSCDCPTRKDALNRFVPGLGDSAEMLINLATLGQGKRLADWWARLRQPKPSLLLRWPHGLGDSVQGTILLQHLRHYFPRWQIDVAVKHGHTVFQGLARQVYLLGDEPPESSYNIARNLGWWEPDRAYIDSPSTKAEKCLREVFRLQPLEELCRYRVLVREPARRRALDYAATLDAPFVLIHYMGTSASHRKNLEETGVAKIVAHVHARGLVPVILDWESPPRSGLVNLPGVANPNAGHPLWTGEHGTGDAESIVALARLATYCVGIDSGPGHLFGATETPAAICWVDHHPINFYALSPNVLHIVPAAHADHIRGDRDAGLDYFARRYRHVVTSRDWHLDFPRVVCDQIDRAIA